MNAMFQDMPEGLYDSLKGKKVFIAGAGGLGSNAAMLLLRAGIDDFIILDYDKVEKSNLNRQFFFHHQIGRYKVDALKDNMLAIQKNARIKIINTKLSSNNISSVFPENLDMVLECFDAPQSKTELIEYMLLNKPKIPVIAVSGIAGKQSPEFLKVTKGPGNLFLVGDNVSGIENGLGTLSTRVMSAAALQAHQAITVLSCLVHNDF